MTTRIDDLVIGTKRRLRGVSARMDGLVGVFRTLAQQHAEALALARRIGGDVEKREHGWPELRCVLLAHERAELRVVYPALREHDDTREMAEQHEVEAAKLEEQIALIDDTYIASDLWADRLGDLVEMLVEHAREEECEIFIHAIATIGVARAKALDPVYEAAYDKLKSSH